MCLCLRFFRMVSRRVFCCYFQWGTYGVLGNCLNGFKLVGLIFNGFNDPSILSYGIRFDSPSLVSVLINDLILVTSYGIRRNSCFGLSMFIVDQVMILTPERIWSDATLDLKLARYCQRCK